MIKKGCKMQHKGVANKEEDINLTDSESEILYLLTEEFLTPKQIAIRRETSHQAIYRIIKSLKEKGAVNGTLSMVAKTRTTMQHKQQIRLHGEEYNIKILYKGNRYKPGKSLNIDGNTVRLYKDSIEVYSGQSFYADDPQKATVKAINYWNRFFYRLEHEFKVILIKPRSQNITLVNSHYAEINNELAKETERKKEKISIYANDDGKLWFKIDNSFNLHEAETLHPQTSKQDMERVKSVFNDIRNKDIDLPSQTRNFVEATAYMIHELAAAQLNQTKLMETLLPKPIKEKSIKIERPDYVG